jgi:dienelactone hydrolase
MRRAALIAVLVLLMLAGGAAAALAWLRLQDPLAALARDPPGAVRLLEERRETWEGRTLLHLVLRGSAVGDVRLVVSLPDPLPPERLPLVVVLGGLEGGTRSMRRISEAVGDPGANAFAAYDWPLPQEEPSALEIALHLRQLRRNVLSVPGQVDALLAWAARQPWADPDRVSLLGFSLGAFVAPAAQRLAEARGSAVQWTIIAYGGAPIGDVIAGHPAVKPAWVGRLLGAGADVLLRPIEPGEHLPHLRGRFLILRAGRDRLIAPAAADRLSALTPEPRTIVVIEGDHLGLGPDKKKLLGQVVAISRAWMVEQGAIRPAPPLRPASSTGVEGRTRDHEGGVTSPR